MKQKPTALFVAPYNNPILVKIAFDRAGVNARWMQRCMDFIVHNCVSQVGAHFPFEYGDVKVSEKFPAKGSFSFKRSDGKRFELQIDGGIWKGVEIK